MIRVDTGRGVSAMKCPSCGREFALDQTWPHVNYCRARYFLAYIETHPGRSAWELSQETGMSYGAATKGMAKAREWETVLCESEERDGGGFRYRYGVAPNWREIMKVWDNRGYS